MKNKTLGIVIVIITSLNIYEYVETGCMKIYGVGALCGKSGIGGVIGMSILAIGGLYLILKRSTNKRAL